MTSFSNGGMNPNHSKNSKFYNRLQAKVLAETFYKLGHDLYKEVLPEVQKHNIKNENIWKLWPANVNLAFSCEIVLKLFYEKDKGTIAHGHKLYKDLFDKLSDVSKKIILDTTIKHMKVNGYKNYSDTEFYDDLQKSENTFANERYVFEIVPGRQHSLHPDFLLSFAEALNELSRVL